MIVAVLGLAVAAASATPALEARAAAATAWSGSGDAGTAEVLVKVQAAEDRIRDVTLRFRQTTRLKATGDRQVTDGDLRLLRKPERFMIRFTTPVEQTAMFDGKALWLYLPGAGQAFRQLASAEDLARLIGLDPTAPVRSFRRGYDAKLEGRDGNGVRIAFTRGGAAPMRWVVRVSATDWLMREAGFENTEVGVSLACYDYRVNRGIAPGSFALRLPKDTEVSDGLPLMPGAIRP